jgi:hypothetical protein
MMMKRWMPRFGTAGLFLLAGCAGGYDERWVPPPPPQQTAETQFDNQAPPTAEPAKTSSRRKGTNYQHWANTAYEKPGASSLAASSKPASSGTAAKTTESGEASTKPLTPAEIRTAVPVDKVANPAKTLASARIKSVWGDVVGQVQSVDVSAGRLTAVDANVVASGDAKRKRVRIDAGRLKYVKSRNLLLTTLSKPDIDKLPKPDQP